MRRTHHWCKSMADRSAVRAMFHSFPVTYREVLMCLRLDCCACGYRRNDRFRSTCPKHGGGSRGTGAGVDLRNFSTLAAAVTDCCAALLLCTVLWPGERPHLRPGVQWIQPRAFTKPLISRNQTYHHYDGVTYASCHRKCLLEQPAAQSN